MPAGFYEVGVDRRHFGNSTYKAGTIEDAFHVDEQGNRLNYDWDVHQDLLEKGEKPHIGLTISGVEGIVGMNGSSEKFREYANVGDGNLDTIVGSRISVCYIGNNPSRVVIPPDVVDNRFLEFKKK